MFLMLNVGICNIYIIYIYTIHGVFFVRVENAHSGGRVSSQKLSEANLRSERFAGIFHASRLVGWWVGK